LFDVQVKLTQQPGEQCTIVFLDLQQRMRLRHAEPIRQGQAFALDGRPARLGSVPGFAQAAKQAHMMRLKLIAGHNVPPEALATSR
jgi:hypothetical protein